jgi:superfamily II DNA or RNA helicase
MSRGVDIPKIDCVYMFCALQFQWAVIQAVGRAMRTFPNKKNICIYDWIDYTVLKSQWYARASAYKKEYWNVLFSKKPILYEKI